MTLYASYPVITLRYFSEMELSDDWPSDETALGGKFVRLGEIILLGATVDYGPIDQYRGKRSYLKHIDMLWHGFQDMGDDVTNRIRQTAPKDGEYLQRKWPLVDAGYSRIRVDGDGQPHELVLDNRSFDYGRPDEPVRQRTGEIAQLVLGTDFLITVE